MQTNHEKSSEQRGAMTAAMRSLSVGARFRGAPSPQGAERQLRIGVIEAGRIVDDRVLSHREPVTVGSVERNTLTLPGIAIERATLFEWRNGYVLQLLPGLEGKLALDDGAAKPLERYASGASELRIGDRARGKLMLGDTTILFQFVDPMPLRPRPALPAAVRGGFLGGVDWFFSSVVATTFLVFCGLLLFLEASDYPLEASIVDVPDYALTTIFEEPEPPPEDSVDPAAVVPDAPEPEATDADDVSDNVSDDVSDDVADSRPSHDASRGERPTRPGPSIRPQPSLVDRASVLQAALLEIGALDNSDGGTAFDRLRENVASTDAADLLAQVDGAVVANRRPTALRPRDGRDHRPSGDDIGALDRVVTRDVVEGREPIREVDPVARVRLSGPIEEPSAGYFDAAIVAQQVRRRVGAIRRCYEREITRNPTLQGRVSVRFTIAEVGTVGGVRAVENTTGSQYLADCVGTSLRTMRFNPGPDGGPASFRFPFIFAPQD